VKRSTAPVRELPAPGDPYLELLKKALSNYLYLGGRQSPTGYYWMKFYTKESTWTIPRQTRPHTCLVIPQLDNLERCLRAVIEAGVPGDFLEAGVYKGGAVIFMRGFLSRAGIKDRLVWAADSFSGIPVSRSAPEGGDAVDSWADRWVASLDEVKANIARYGLLDDQVRFLPGLFHETLPKAPIKALAVARLDGDSYESTMDALSALYPRLSPGGYLVIDDWHLPGCRQAVADYRARYGIDEAIQVNSVIHPDNKQPWDLDAYWRVERRRDFSKRRPVPNVRAQAPAPSPVPRRASTLAERWVSSWERLVRRLVPEPVLRWLARGPDDALKRTLNDPEYLRAESRSPRLLKRDWLLGVYDALSQAGGPSRSVERRETVTREQFLRDYYSVNRPVVLTQAMRGEKALAWTPQLFKERFGDRIIEVQADRGSDRRYEERVEAHRRNMPLGTFVDQVLAGRSTNDYYMTGNNFGVNAKALAELFAEAPDFPDLLDPKLPGSQRFLWLGPAGTVTPLHHDLTNNLFAQIHGRKRFLLVPSYQLPYLYNDRHVFTDVDPEAVDLDKHPLFAKARVHEVVLGPGEVLFLPIGWWHHVRALDASISVSYTNFRFPNYYPSAELRY
jgi:hypothetical protein